MSDRRDQYVETRKLVGFLRDIINQRKIVENQPINWEVLFKTADYHNVANLLYYALLRLHQEVPREWSLRFSQKYRKAVILEEQYKNVVEAVLWHCEEQGIHVMVLDDFILRDYYSMPEMRAMPGVEFLVEKRRRPEIDRMMHSMDFIPVVGEYSYMRSGLNLVFRERLPFADKKTANYFGKSLRFMPKAQDGYYAHAFKEPSLFIFLIACKAERFALEELDIRDMLDIWLCYRSQERGNAWLGIIKKLKRLRLWEFTNRMLTLSDHWFGSGTLEGEPELYEDLESFVFSKGADGRQTAMKILPLLRRTIRHREKQEKKKRRKSFERWLFPEQEYMQIIYPRMGKYKIFLPVCWVRRLLRTLFSHIRQKLQRTRQA